VDWVTHSHGSRTQKRDVSNNATQQEEANRPPPSPSRTGRPSPSLPSVEPAPPASLPAGGNLPAPPLSHHPSSLLAAVASSLEEPMWNPSQPSSPSATGQNSGRRHSSPPPVGPSMKSSRSPLSLVLLHRSGKGPPPRKPASGGGAAAGGARAWWRARPTPIRRHNARFNGGVTDSGHAPARSPGGEAGR
jgi:hypothetical protein